MNSESMPPSPAHVASALRELEGTLGPSKATSDPRVCESFARDESEASARQPDIVVFASSVKEISTALAVASKYDVPVTPRAGGTGRSGGAIPVCGGIVLVTSGLGAIKEINRADMLAVVEPGVILSDFHDACEGEGLFYPPDPNSLKTCQIGGNVAENAGGPRAFKYGVTGTYVLGLEACLVGGEVLRTGRRTIKGVTGYDVTSLLVGSEGTLAVFSEVTLRLLRKPPELVTLLALFRSSQSAAQSVAGILASGVVPRCLELVDEGAIEAIVAQKVPIDSRARAFLLIDLDDRDQEACLERLGDLLLSQDGIIDVQVAQDASRRAEIWAARRALSPATKKLARHKIAEDVVVPRSKMAELLLRVSDIGQRESVRNLTYGHAGDGNLHVNLFWNDDDERPSVERALHAIMKTTVSLGGTLSGEHGIGLTKIPYMQLEQSDSLMMLQKKLKQAFDPKNLLNPGKIFPHRGHGAC